MTTNQAAQKTVMLSHGGGGRLTRDMIRDYFLSAFHNPTLDTLSDAALLEVGGTRLAFTTDSFVVKPPFFPGGNIGHLAISGTINDLSVMGARPLAVSAGFVIEEGFDFDSLREIIDSMQLAAKEAGVSIVTGDTKVVERGSADKVFINTSGIGVVITGGMSAEKLSPGDVLLINGTLGDHGIAVLSAREDLPIRANIESDAAPLNTLIMPILEKFPGNVKFMRDATRGGFATVLNEVTEGSDFGIDVDESAIPVKEPVRAMCDMLGFDPLYVANEGKVVFIVKNEAAGEILAYMKTLPYGTDAVKVGELTAEHAGRVVLRTKVGGGRILDMLIGDQLPRIC